jgi:hypothetical protein
MKNETPGKAADVFMMLAEEADIMMKTTSESARKEASDETEKFLLEYEQRARKIILKTRENARLQASEIAERFKEALMLRIEETSALAMSQIMASVGTKTEEMVQRLQQAAQSEVRQALAGAFAGNQVVKESVKPEPTPVAEIVSKKSQSLEINIEPNNMESFETWLTQ